MQDFLKRILWVLGLVALQFLVFNHVHLLGCITPLVYVYILCLQPVSTSRNGWLLWGFLTGLLADFFSETPGLGAASMTFTAMWAPGLLHLFAPKDCLDDMVPGYATLGKWSYVCFISMIVLLQHAVFILLEVFSFFNVWDMCYAYLGSSALTILLILVLEYVRESK